MIDDTAKLQALIAQLESAPWIALDTEANSLHAYPEQLCLIQISIEGADVIIDPLALDVSPLWPVLSSHRLLMHGADYDLRLFWKNYRFVPSDIFDTMLAARLLGAREFGLNTLLTRHLNVTLEKSSQKADWSKRPLTERMEAYARNDTRYLRPLVDLLEQQLKAAGRLDWHRQLCQKLIQDCSNLSEPDPNRVWRIKGSSRLSRHALAVLRSIWQWREKEAREACRPPYFILSHELLIELAIAALASQGFENIIPRHIRGSRRTGLVHAIEQAISLPEAEHPEYLDNRMPRVTERMLREIERQKRNRDAHAVHLGIDPTLIASRAELQISVETGSDEHLLPWQREIMATPPPPPPPNPPATPGDQGASEPPQTQNP